MKITSALSVITLLTALACSKKTNSDVVAPVGVTTPASSEKSASATSTVLSKNLHADLIEFGLSSSQANIVSGAGTLAVSNLGLHLSSESSAAEVTAYTEAVIAVLDDDALALTQSQHSTILEVIVGAEFRSLGEIAGEMSAEDQIGILGHITGAIIANLDEGGFAADQMMAAVGMVASAATESLDETGITEESLGDAVSTIIESSVANLDDTGIEIGSAASFITEINSNVVGSFDGIEGIEAGDMAELVKYATAGSLVGASSLDGFAGSYVDDFALATSRGVMSGTDEIADFDPTLYAEFAKSSAEGLFSSAQEMEGFEASYFEQIAEGSAEGSIEGAQTIDGFAIEYFDDIAKGAANGVSEGASSLPDFDPSLLDEMASAVSAAIMDGFEGYTGAGVNQNFIESIGAATNEGYLVGAGNFDDLTADFLKAIGDAGTAGILEGVSSGAFDDVGFTINLGALAQAADSGATDGAAAASQQLECEAQPDKTWFAEYNICITSASASGGAAIDPEAICLADSGVWVAAEQVCYHDADAMAVCTAAGGTFANHSCSMPVSTDPDVVAAQAAAQAALDAEAAADAAAAAEASCVAAGGTYAGNTCTIPWTLLGCSAVSAMGAQDLETYANGFVAASTPNFCSVMTGMESCSSFTIPGATLASGDPGMCTISE